MSITLLYDVNAYWEKDYTTDLFNEIKNIKYLTSAEIHELCVNNNELINNNILVFSSNIYSYEQILNIVLKIKPIIIVHLSDECGNKPEYTHLALHTKLLLHQYNFNVYPYSNYNNIIQIPLGYMTHMFNGKNAFDVKFKPLLIRKYIWSFVGNLKFNNGDIKHDRLEIINKFTNKFNNNYVGNNISPQEMFDIYNDTIFVPNGRGNNRLDCFRIYEAILSGCIPIIVGNEDEIIETFYYNKDIPPFFCEKTWDDAIVKCEYLLKNTNELVKLQKKNYMWLQNKIVAIQKKINNILIK
jgi:hypothetical protein